jgi:ppGpp synthetase/RelA/SpoT-type nucleotidyltranferase
MNLLSKVDSDRLAEWAENHPNVGRLSYDIRKIVDDVVTQENDKHYTESMTVEDIDSNMIDKRQFSRMNLPVLAKWLAKRVHGTADGATVRLDGKSYRLEQHPHHLSVYFLAEDGTDSFLYPFALPNLIRMAEELLRFSRNSVDAATVEDVTRKATEIVSKRRAEGFRGAALGHLLPRHISPATLAKIIKNLRSQGLEVDTRTPAPMVAAGFSDLSVSWEKIPKRGGIRNPTISARDPHISRKDYPGVFWDTGHGVPGVDDPYPGQPCPTDVQCPDTVEEVRLSDEIGKLIDLRKSYQHDLDDMLGKLKKSIGPDTTIKGRVKTPFSILNKLRRKRITGEHGLTDVAGAMIVASDYAGVKQAASTVERIYPVVSREDYYEKPLSGYRAYHLIVALPGDRRAEVQIKSRRMAEISHASHTPYKEERLNATEMNRLTALADRADRGDRVAARKIDGILARGESAVEHMLTLRTNHGRT